MELDYNAAELRVLLGLSGKQQPTEDLHIWNLNNIYRGNGTRDEVKKRIFSWLYNPQSKDYAPRRFYDREGILRKYWNGQVVITPMDRVISADKHHALNYLIQSTTADRVLEKAVLIDKMLEGKKSFISHIVHDEIVIDYADKDRDIVIGIRDVFEDGYVANLRAGKDYYNLNEIKL